ncbi:MAG: hypothetical protein AB4058_12535 [Microcystaceae cyanobacterium]
MDRLQRQINTLNNKVDQLHQIVESLTGQLTVFVDTKTTSPAMTSFSDQSLQPLPNLTYREEKSVSTPAHLIEVKDSRELVGNGNGNGYYHHDSYSETGKLVGNGNGNGNGNGRYHDSSYSETGELVGNGNGNGRYHDPSYSETDKLVGNGNGNGHYHDPSYSETGELLSNGNGNGNGNGSYHHDSALDNGELVDNHHQTDNNKTHISDYNYPGEYHRSLREHEDILVDDKLPQSTLPDPLHEPRVASEIQIRRLMAQLTAAYNRIALLEEQLLACRMKS